LCPKKPTTTKVATNGKATGVLDRPIDQGFTASGNKRAPTTIRKEATKVIETSALAVSNEVVKRTIEAYKKDPEQVKGALRSLALGLGKLGIIGAAAVAVFKLAAATNRARSDIITRMVFEALNATKAELVPRGQWKPEFTKILVPQYEAFFRSEMAKLNRK
jgi:hypothetical protein